MSQKILENKKLLLEVSPNMGASILRFIDKENKKNIFRSFPVKKRQGKYNCYFSGYFATIPYFGAIHKNTFFYKNKYINLPRTHILEPDTIHGEGWINKWKVKKYTKNILVLEFLHNGKNSFPYKYKSIQTFNITKDSLIIRLKIDLANELFKKGYKKSEILRMVIKELKLKRNPESRSWPKWLTNIK